MLAAFDLPENHFWIHAKQVRKQIQLADFRKVFRTQRLTGAKVGHHDASRAFRNQDGAVQRVKQRIARSLIERLIPLGESATTSLGKKPSQNTPD